MMNDKVKIKCFSDYLIRRFVLDIAILLSHVKNINLATKSQLLSNVKRTALLSYIKNAISMPSGTFNLLCY